MGIKDLSKLIAEHAAGAIKENEMKNYFGRKVAIDASMALYQFMIAVRQEGDFLTNEAGEVTSHLLGMFHRTIRMVDQGIKPLWVFDGTPPELKSATLEKRKERRGDAEKNLEEAKETGGDVEIEKFSRRLVKITKEHNDEAKKLLKLMGIPFMTAPSEAEAQCAALVRGGVVYATATEDMDALTFASSILLRHMTFSEAKKMPIQEFHLAKVLEGFGMTQDQFIDLCILLGCDYCDKIKGIGPNKAFTLIKEHGNLEAALKSLDKKKYQVPEDWPYEAVQAYFRAPEVAAPADLTFKWEAPDEAGLIQFLCTEKGFAEERVRKNMEKLKKQKSGPVQGRMEDYFKAIPASPKPSTSKDLAKAKLAEDMKNFGTLKNKRKPDAKSPSKPSSAKKAKR
ncbi:hypothetical protein RvY_10238 [Ramazzottius varieornatus]|uniref:Flap endonuclease 1 n=1 Tax=Ramazzottius varieornatus TaxID=947166 RepID=A0A1D1VEK0_RAMVA|nr:hypothetical protein RvY_10238 [Ramazzottius varieornatus]